MHARPSLRLLVAAILAGLSILSWHAQTSGQFTQLIARSLREELAHEAGDRKSIIVLRLFTLSVFLPVALVTSRLVRPPDGKRH